MTDLSVLVLVVIPLTVLLLAAGATWHQARSDRAFDAGIENARAAYSRAMLELSKAQAVYDAGLPALSSTTENGRDRKPAAMPVETAGPAETVHLSAAGTALAAAAIGASGSASAADPAMDRDLAPWLSFQDRPLRILASDGTELSAISGFSAVPLVWYFGQKEAEFDRLKG